MSQKITFETKPRTIIGKKVSQLRRQGLIPGNVSGDTKETLALVVDQAKFDRLYDQVGDTGLFYLKVEGEKSDRPVLVCEVQHDPITGISLHVVFRQVDLSEKITAEVPVEVIGEVEIKDAIVATLHNTIEVEALPQDLPEKFEIDVSSFTEIGQMVTYKDLQFDRSKVSLMVDEAQLDEPVVMIQEVKEEVEQEPAPVEGADGEAGTAETPATETPAEGEAPAAEAAE
jgi:large subunit ribosomal protein L25